MTFTQRLSLLWRRFSPLEERLLAVVREVLPSQAQSIFDSQVGSISLVQRHPNEVCFYRKRSGKVDWSDVPTFPRTGEFRLAEVRFRVAKKRYTATLTSVGGHIFDFTITPSPKAIAFAEWDAAPSTRLLADPMVADSSNEPPSLPESWRELLAKHQKLDAGDWTFHDATTAYRRALADGDFLVLAEREGDQFVLHRIEPPAATLFYLDSHDGKPEPVTDLLEILKRPYE